VVVKSSRMTYVLRQPEAADRVALIRLFEDFQAVFVAMDPLSRERCEAGYGEVRADVLLKDSSGRRRTWLAQAGSELVGVCSATWEDATAIQRLSTATRRRGRIVELFVGKAHRRSGIGEDLLRKAEAWLSAAGCDVVRIEVFAPNKSARRFYEVRGYHVRDMDMIKLTA